MAYPLRRLGQQQASFIFPGNGAFFMKNLSCLFDVTNDRGLRGGVCTLAAAWLGLTTLAAAPLPTPLPPEPDFDASRLDRPQPEEWPVAAPVETGQLTVSAEDLLAQPDLLQRALDSAVELENIEGVRELLPLYRQLPQPDAMLLRYASALLARAEGDYGQAFALYREMVAEQPELLPVRWQLARSLAEDRQHREAGAEWAALRQEAGLPLEVQQQIDAQQAYLRQQEGWQLAGSVRYLQESNVNQAPEQRSHNGWLLPEPESAHGFGYELSAQKTQALAGHWAWRLSAAAYGKFYWNRHRYDDAIVRLSAGAVYREARQEWAWLPYYERRWFGTEPYSQTVGLRVQGMYALSPRWQLAAAVQHGLRRHDERHFLDGSHTQLALTVWQRISPHQFWLLGLDGSREQTRDRSDAYQRVGVRLGWEGEWASAVGAALQVSAAQRQYAAADVFQIRRHEQEYAVHAALWRPGWQWQGFTPRLSWQWQRIKSNHFAYGYRKNQVFMEVVRRF